MMKQGPLYRLQKGQEAIFQETNGWIVPATFSSPDHELAILNTSVGLVDLSGWGVLRLNGDNQLDFVHRMSTNDVAGLGPDQGIPTVFTTPIGRIVDLAFVFVREQDLLLFVGQGADEVVAAWLRKHIFFNDDVTVEIITSQVALMGLRGPGATALVHQLVGNGGVDLIFDGCTTRIVDIEVTMMHSVPLGNDYLLITAAKDAPALWSALSAAVASVGGGPVGELAIEAERVAAGSPRFGRELSEEYIPLEAGLKWAVSFNKGCYVGQEVIARMETFQRLAKRLVVLGADDPHMESSDGGTSVGSWLEAGAEVRVDGLKVGRVTSVSPVVDEGSVKALAYIKTALAEPGRQVEVVSDSGTLMMCVLSVPNEG